MSSTESRLDRQVILIEAGSTQVVRNMAADQLGDLANQHPEQILPLLSRVYPYLLSKQWETRVTAARAVGGIVSHANIWDPNDEDDQRGEDNETNDNEDNSSLDRHGSENMEESAKVKIEHDMKIKLEEATKTEEWDELQDETHYLS